jgi:NAD(P)-dependent dehydrogenase (short-subunit alcohol dehydrogenase family)
VQDDKPPAENTRSHGDRGQSSRKRVCLLTGAGGRLGCAFIASCRTKYEIVAVYRSHIPLAPSQFQQLIDPLSPTALLADNENPIYTVQADLCEDTDRRRVVEVALARFGTIDVIINAAATSTWGPIIGSSRVLDSAERQYLLNVVVPLQLTARVATQTWRNTPDENARRRRHVVNISSIGGRRLITGSGQGVYSATKAALNHLSRHMAFEFGGINVRVNAVAPCAFPRVVTTGSVIEAITTLDDSDKSGVVREVLPEGFIDYS